MKKHLKWILLAVVVLAIGYFGYRYWLAKQSDLPEGIFEGNGRIEAKLVDVVAKEPLRVKQILVDEGDFVNPGQVLVKLDTVTLDSDLAAAKLNAAATQESVAITKAAIVRRKSDVDLAKIELERARKLLEEHAGSQREYDASKTKVETTSAALEEENAKLKTVQQQVEVALTNAATIQTRIDDATLKSPVRGRVLYRLAEVGEVLGAGGKAMTLVNMQDVYMEIFLPSEEASKVTIGADARIVFDYLPDRVVGGRVTFVSPEAQFTPKQVETRKERDKLMFRVKIQVPSELVTYYIQHVKTGVRGVGYVKGDAAAEWPQRLQKVMVAPESQPATAPTNSTSKPRDEAQTSTPASRPSAGVP